MIDFLIIYFSIPTIPLILFLLLNKKLKWVTKKKSTSYTKYFYKEDVRYYTRLDLIRVFLLWPISISFVIYAYLIEPFFKKYLSIPEKY